MQQKDWFRLALVCLHLSFCVDNNGIHIPLSLSITSEYLYQVSIELLHNPEFKVAKIVVTQVLL